MATKPFGKLAHRPISSLEHVLAASFFYPEKPKFSLKLALPIKAKKPGSPARKCAAADTAPPARG